ncbi:MAG: VOC family protein [Bacteroidota bacterium]
MKRVTGLGGVFFKCDDPEKVQAWYSKHLDINAGQFGTMFVWRQKDAPDMVGTTTWSTFQADTDYFDPSQKDYMFNYRVDNLVELLKVLEAEGVQIVGEMQEFEYGKFAWIMDPEGNKIELWEPLDMPLVAFEKMQQGGE